MTTPLLDAGGEVRGYSKVTHDITQRHLAQVALEEKTRALEEAQETLIRKERLAVVGELAGGVSHELRNPLGVIANSVYYLRMVVPESPKVEKHLGILEREVRTATAIVTELLDFSRTRPPTPTLVDLNALVVEQLERITVPGAVIRRDLAPDLPGVGRRPGAGGARAGQSTSNAVQAMLDGGTLTVASAHSNGSAALAVVDTGTGIAADVLTRIFEPLFTTKNRGIGLGLSIARNLTEANGGTIAVESGPGQGTRFTLRFRIPASKAAPPRPGENGRAPGALPRGGLDADGAAVSLRQNLGDGQPEPDAPGPRREERLEDALEVLGREALARVAHRGHHGAVGAPGRDGQVSAERHGLDGILDHVAEDEQDLTPVRRDGRRVYHARRSPQ